MIPSHSLLAFAAALCTMATALPALATNDFYLEEPGVTVIGNIDDNAWAVTVPWGGGTCHWQFLEAGGLSYHSRIHGTSDNDFIIVLWTGTMDWCGTDMERINTTHALHVDAAGGDDIISYGIPYAKFTQLDGGLGDDWIGGKQSIVDGESGDDCVLGGKDAFLEGSFDDDIVCASPGTTPKVMYGGPGYDIRYGSATTTTGFESTASNCSACNLF